MQSLQDGTAVAFYKHKTIQGIQIQGNVEKERDKKNTAAVEVECRRRSGARRLVAVGGIVDGGAEKNVRMVQWSKGCVARKYKMIQVTGGVAGRCRCQVGFVRNSRQDK
jgi:hypothetical protein